MRGFCFMFWTNSLRTKSWTLGVSMLVWTDGGRTAYAMKKRGKGLATSSGEFERQRMITSSQGRIMRMHWCIELNLADERWIDYNKIFINNIDTSVNYRVMIIWIMQQRELLVVLSHKEGWWTAANLRVSRARRRHHLRSSQSAYVAHKWARKCEGKARRTE